ncbi:hypothetical protein MHU86_11081 [Fragilaria crotonensis]|nr:hypothetical protein MHU86_11081 [Fragilaria crotonensis]
MQQYLVLCAGVEHEDEINPALLEFRSTRQQLEDGAFVFPACDFLKERLGRGVDQRATRSLTFSERRERHLAGVPRSRPKWTDPEHVLQVAPKREVRQELFLERLARRPHDRTDDRRTSVDRAVGAHARPSSDATPPSKKTKLGPSASAYFQPAFVAQPSQWAFDQERPRRPVTKRSRAWALRSALDSPPTDHSVARALSPGDAHDAPTSALADTPRPLPGKFPSLVPLPTIPLPNVDSPFPRLPEPRLADALATILHSGQPRTHATEFRFDWTHDAARHNLAVLKRYALDLDAALRAQPFSALTPGSEFRPTELLAPLLSAHPLWPRFQERISEGAEFPLREISDSDRLADVRANLARGNHKSARGHEAKLISMLKDEASRGWQLPLPREAALEIKGCEVAPLGMVAQTSIDERKFNRETPTDT